MSPARANVPIAAKVDLRSAFCFATSSLLAVLAGCLVARAAGVGPGVWGRNVAAWLIGGMAALLLGRLRPLTLFRGVLLLTPALLAVSLAGPGQSGVHRWISTGPLHWNVAFLLLPAAGVAVAAAAQSGWRWTWWCAAAIQLELLLQPDASQATAFTAAIAIAAPTVRPPAAGLLVAGLCLALAIFTWTRPDPLAPIPEVEGILTLAAAVSGGLAALCVAALVAVALSPLAAWRQAGPPALALSVYFCLCASMPLFGAFPVPIAGMGMSPIIGFWLGMAALLRARRTAPPA